MTRVASAVPLHTLCKHADQHKIERLWPYRCAYWISVFSKNAYHSCAGQCVALEKSTKQCLYPH